MCLMDHDDSHLSSLADICDILKVGMNWSVEYASPKYSKHYINDKTLFTFTAYIVSSIGVIEVQCVYITNPTL